MIKEKINVESHSSNRSKVMHASGVDEMNIGQWFNRYVGKLQDKTSTVEELSSSQTRSTVELQPIQELLTCESENFSKKSSNSSIISFPIDQVGKLEEAYRYTKKSKKPSEWYQKLAKDLGMDQSRVRQWFNHRRSMKRSRDASPTINDPCLNEPETILHHILQQPCETTRNKTCSNKDSRKTKHRILMLTLDQLKSLEKEFSRAKYQSRQGYIKLAKDLKMDEMDVRKWFRKSRFKERLKYAVRTSNKSLPTSSVEKSSASQNFRLIKASDLDNWERCHQIKLSEKQSNDSSQLVECRPQSMFLQEKPLITVQQCHPITH